MIQGVGMPYASQTLRMGQLCGVEPYYYYVRSRPLHGLIKAWMIPRTACLPRGGEGWGAEAGRCSGTTPASLR